MAFVRKMLVAVALGGLLVACGTEPRPSDETPEATSTPADTIGYSCDGYPPAYRLDDPYEEVPEDLWAAVERLRKNPIDPGLHVPTREDSDLVVLTETYARFLTKEPPYSGTSFEKEGDRWRWAGGGDCELVAVAEGGLETATWWMPEEAKPEDEVLTVRAMQISCASATKRRPEEFEPLVEETDERIAVAMFVEPLEGQAFECPGNPDTGVRIELEQPVGDRQIVDVGTYPERPAPNRESFGQ